MLVPHGIDADPAGGEVVEDVGPGGVAGESDEGVDVQVACEQAEAIDFFGVGVVADGADEDEFRILHLLTCWLTLILVHHARKRLKDHLVVLFWPELRNVEDDAVALPCPGPVELDALFQFLDRDWGEHGFDGPALSAPRAFRAPERLDVRLGPGGIRHDDVDVAAGEAVEPGVGAPVEAFGGAFEASACAGVEAVCGVWGGEGVEHVGGDGGVVDVCGGGDGGAEKEGAEGESEGVAHCVNEEVRDEKGEGVVGHEEGAEALA